MPTPRPIIILGCPRSGTTLLWLMLHAHSRIAIPPENRFVMSCYRRRRRFGDLQRVENRQRLATWLLSRKNSKLADFGLDPELLRERIAAAPPTVGSALAAVFGAYAERFDAPRWGDKRPAYYQDVAALRRMFPTTQFIHLIRDGRDCVASLKHQFWWRGDSVTATVVWGEAIDYGRRWRRRLPGDSWYELRYEDLVADPRSRLHDLCRYLGEDFEEAMLEAHALASAVLPERNLTAHHRLTLEPVTTRRVGASSAGLTPDELALFNHVHADRLRRWGYDLPVHAPPPPSESVRRYDEERRSRRRDQRRRHLRDWTDQLRSRQPVRDLTS